jgi:hypothetical protein
MSKPLTGKKLLQQIQELSGASRKEKAKVCGYVSYTEDGQERVNLIQFYNAILAAEGLKLDASEVGKQGRDLSYRTSVHKNGTLVIGAGYTQKLGLNPGDEFELKLGNKHIQLQKVA